MPTASMPSPCAGLEPNWVSTRWRRTDMSQERPTFWTPSWRRCSPRSRYPNPGDAGMCGSGSWRGISGPRSSATRTRCRWSPHGPRLHQQPGNQSRRHWGCWLPMASICKPPPTLSTACPTSCSAMPLPKWESARDQTAVRSTLRTWSRWVRSIRVRFLTSQQRVPRRSTIRLRSSNWASTGCCAHSGLDGGPPQEVTRASGAGAAPVDSFPLERLQCRHLMMPPIDAPM